MYLFSLGINKLAITITKIMLGLIFQFNFCSRLIIDLPMFLAWTLTPNPTLPIHHTGESKRHFKQSPRTQILTKRSNHIARRITVTTVDLFNTHKHSNKDQCNVK